MGTTTILSFEEFERLPDEPGKVELLDGELIQLPPAKRKHMELVRRIMILLTRAVENGMLPPDSEQSILRLDSNSAAEDGSSRT